MSNPEISLRATGTFNVRVLRKDGSERYNEDHKNMLLDVGLIGLLSGNFYSVIKVGTGNSAPSATQTGLDAILLTGNTLGVGLTGTDENGPWFGWGGNITTAAFESNQNISELGIGATTSSSVITRALTVDSSGTPAAITVLAGEILVVGYSFRIYRPTIETPAVTGSIPLVVDGVSSSVSFSSVFDGPYGIASNLGLHLNITSSVYLLESTVSNFTASRDGVPAIVQGGAEVTMLATKPSGAAGSITRIKTTTTGSAAGRIAATFTPPITVTADQRAQVRWKVRLMRFEP